MRDLKHSPFFLLSAPLNKNLSFRSLLLIIIFALYDKNS